MLFISGLVGALLLLTAEARVGNSSKNSFCTETEECLLHDFVCKNDEYEVRYYSSAKWVATEEKGYVLDFAMISAFRRLFNYITGENDKGEYIAMTAPVIVKVEDDKYFWKKRTFTISFLLPSSHQRSPPMPTDKEVYLHDMPDLHVYVLSYGGWMTGLSDMMKSHTLCRALDSAGANYKYDFHYAVGYNSPMTWFHRHNEVWYVAEGKPECSSSEETDWTFPLHD